MQVIDILIQSTTLLSFVWLIIEFIRFCSQHQPAAPAQPELAESTSQQSQFNHVIVPFHRPATRPAPSDRELVELAKSTGYPGSAKWSYSRKLSRPVRSELLKLCNRSEVSA